MAEAMTTSQLLAAASELLHDGGYTLVPATDDWVDPNSRLFEDPYGIVAVFTYETWGDLSATWQDAQGRLVDLISTHLRRPEAKAWEGYVVLLTPSPTPLDARANLAEIRYDTNRVRKLVATGDELKTLDDVLEALLPLLPLDVEEQIEASAALLDRLPALLADHGIEPQAAQSVIRAFMANESPLERLHELRSEP